MHRAALVLGVTLFLLGATAVASNAVVATPSGQECAAGDSGCEADVPPFVPSDTWQEVLPGQIVPPSCDLRIDLETGKEFARNQPTQSPGLSDVTEAEPLDPAEAAVRDAKKTAKMYEILMGLPEPPSELESPAIAQLSKEELEDLIQQQWERRQAHLKDTYEDVQTEQEMLSTNLKLLSGLFSPEDDEQLSYALEELEYLVAQTDNARTVANLNGWPSIVRGLSAPTDAVATASAWVVGTAVKLDDEVQNAALDANAMAQLIALLPQVAATASATDPRKQRSVETVTKATFAIGHLLRGNRRSQRLFLENAGPELFREGLMLGNLTTNGISAGAASPEFRKSVGLISKVLALITDLIDESNTLPTLVSELTDNRWCEAVSSVATSLPRDSEVRDEGSVAIIRKVQELSMQTMNALLAKASDAPGCGGATFSRGMTDSLQQWFEGWTAEANQPGEDGEYPEQLAELAEALLAQAEAPR